jgi:type VI secretion system secreted protein Hcp
MAMTVHLFMKANNQDIQGDSSITSMGRENSIECISFSDSVQQTMERNTGMPTGNRTYGPITITKRIEKSTPLLAKALTGNEVIEADFKFYRPNPAGDGTTQHFYTVHIEEGRITSINRVSPDVTNPASANDPAKETVKFVAQLYRWTYEPDGVEHIDRWSEQP